MLSAVHKSNEMFQQPYADASVTLDEISNSLKDTSYQIVTRRNRKI